MRLVIRAGVELPNHVKLILPEGMRDELRRPLGPVVPEDALEDHLDTGSPIATVGDMCTATLDSMGLDIKIAVVDLQTKRCPDPRWREAMAHLGDITVLVRNPPAVLTAALYNAIMLSWNSRGSVKVVVEGEEDLAALPAILHAPEGATVIYGIPDTGLALVQVDEDVKAVVTDALERFILGTARAAPSEGD